MDRYLDLFRYYASPSYKPGYGFAYALSAADLPAFARARLDAYAGYFGPLPHQSELLPLRRYSALARSLSPRRRANPRRRPSAQAGIKRRPPPAQKLAPKKTPFKKTQKRFVEKSTPNKGPKRREKERKVGNVAGKPQKSSAASLAKETQELHSLFRTGVDTFTGKKLVKPSPKKSDGTPLKNSNRNFTGQKRKAKAQRKDEGTRPVKKPRGKKKKKLANEKQQELKKDEKPIILAPKTLKAEPPVLTEEETKEAKALLALQNAACKAVGEFLGIPNPENRVEREKSEALDASADDAKLDKAQPSPDAEAQAKLDEAPNLAPLTPEEEKVLEEKGYKFFSKILEENQDLRNLYLEKKDAGTFECLVCHSIDPETSKKFSNMTSLVMHTSMRKQKRPEHRGYGQALCDVLGWELLRGPKQSSKQVKEEGDLATQPKVDKVLEEENQ